MDKSRAKELIITNGDSAGDLLRAVYSDSTVLPWRDVLHEGPVPMTIDLMSLSDVRAEFLSNKYTLDPGQTMSGFRERDDQILDYGEFDDVVLWFEHDLYDQLQLIQLLDFFANNPKEESSVHLVQADEYLGEQNSESIVSFEKFQQIVTLEQLNLGQKAWRAFRQATPESWAKLLGVSLVSLPFLNSAVHRMLEELPSTLSGISRTQHQILSLIDQGISQSRELFTESQKLEKAAFMGDWSFCDQLWRLINSPLPLISGPENSSFQRDQKPVEGQVFPRENLKITSKGHAVLLGKEDYARFSGVDFWWGGTHITNDNLWRWDSDNRQIFKL